MEAVFLLLCAEIFLTCIRETRIAIGLLLSYTQISIYSRKNVKTNVLFLATEGRFLFNRA